MLSKKHLAKIFFWLTVGLSIGSESVTAKILIFSYAFNLPDFIEKQVRTLNKFLEDEFELVVFNNARKKNLEERITSECKRLNIACIRVPQNVPLMPGPACSSHHAGAIRYSLETLGYQHDSILVLLDSDMFLTRNFCIRDYLDGHQLAAWMRRSQPSGVQFMWPGIAFIDMANLPDKEQLCFDIGSVKGAYVDTGGHTYHYLKAHPNTSLKRLDMLRINRRHSIEPFERTISCDKCTQGQSMIYGPLCKHPRHIICESCRAKKTYKCTHNTQELRELGLGQEEIELIQGGMKYIEFYANKAFLHYKDGMGSTDQNGNLTEHGKFKTTLMNEYLRKILAQS